jgi:hypothetical protein
MKPKETTLDSVAFELLLIRLGVSEFVLIKLIGRE